MKQFIVLAALAGLAAFITALIMGPDESLRASLAGVWVNEVARQKIYP